MPETKYVYQSRQASVLLPYYRRWLWNPMLERLPASLSPNAMTLISTAACALSFLLAATAAHSAAALLVAALLVLIYVTLDNLDGAQARKIGRSSPLGEFLDHWLDTLNNGFVVLGACLAGGLPPLLIAAVLGSATLAFFSVQWELRRTGVFRMGRVADIEGNTTVALLYVAIAIFGQDALQLHPLPFLPSLAVLMGLGVMGQALGTLFSAASRVSQGRSDFIPIGLAQLAVLAWAASGALSPLAYLSLGFFVNPVFTTRAICKRLLDRETPGIDWIVALSLLVASGLSLLGAASTSADQLAFGLAACLAALTTWHCVASIARLERPPPRAAPDRRTP